MSFPLTAISQMLRCLDVPPRTKVFLPANCGGSRPVQEYHDFFSDLAEWFGTGIDFSPSALRITSTEHETLKAMAWQKLDRDVETACTNLQDDDCSDSDVAIWLKWDHSLPMKRSDLARACYGVSMAPSLQQVEVRVDGWSHDHWAGSFERIPGLRRIVTTGYAGSGLCNVQMPNSVVALPLPELKTLVLNWFYPVHWEPPMEEGNAAKIFGNFLTNFSVWLRSRANAGYPLTKVVLNYCNVRKAWANEVRTSVSSVIIREGINLLGGP